MGSVTGSLIMGDAAESRGPGGGRHATSTRAGNLGPGRDLPVRLLPLIRFRADRQKWASSVVRQVVGFRRSWSAGGCPYGRPPGHRRESRRLGAWGLPAGHQVGACGSDRHSAEEVPSRLGSATVRRSCRRSCGEGMESVSSVGAGHVDQRRPAGADFAASVLLFCGGEPEQCAQRPAQSGQLHLEGQRGEVDIELGSTAAAQRHPGIGQPVSHCPGRDPGGRSSWRSSFTRRCISTTQGQRRWVVVVSDRTGGAGVAGHQNQDRRSSRAGMLDPVPVGVRRAAYGRGAASRDAPRGVRRGAG